jgi:UDP-glucose 4-epimerase
VQSDPVWVIGAGGLLGKGLVAELGRRGNPVLTGSIPWSRPDDAVAALRAGAERLRVAANGGPWRIAWCAGAGVTGSSQDALDSELDVLRRGLAAFAEVLAPPQEGSPASDVVPGKDHTPSEGRDPGSAGRRGHFFLASSAGGVYAGAPNPPFTEESPTAPLAPYGWAKLRAEAAVRDFAAATGVRALIGRISNLYGPGQNLDKAQGLISVFARADVTAQPVTLYVSLDTLRDYLFVGDAARLVAAGLDRLGQADVRNGETVLKILASHRADTIGSIIGVCRTVFKRRPLVVLGASPSAKAQAVDLRLRSVVWPELDRVPVTPLAAGLSATASDIQHLLAAGRLRRP